LPRMGTKLEASPPRRCRFVSTIRLRPSSSFLSSRARRPVLPSSATTSPRRCGTRYRLSRTFSSRRVITTPSQKRISYLPSSLSPPLFATFSTSTEGANVGDGLSLRLLREEAEELSPSLPSQAAHPGVPLPPSLAVLTSSGSAPGPSSFFIAVSIRSSFRIYIFHPPFFFSLLSPRQH